MVFGFSVSVFLDNNMFKNPHYTGGGGAGAAASAYAIPNVKDAPYNATGDGTTDDTAAIQAALDAFDIIYIPEGTYRISTLNCNAGQMILGAGQSTILKKKAATTGYIINAGTNSIQVHNIDFDGNQTGPWVADTTIGTTHGVYLYAAGGSALVSNCRFYDFDGAGVMMEGDSNITNRDNRGVVEKSWFRNCQTGIRLGDTNTAEYTAVRHNNCKDCYVGILQPCANVTVLGNELTDCEFGWDAKPSNGRSHSKYVGNTVHHSKIRFYNCWNGSLVTGNSFFSTTVNLLADSPGTANQDCRGIEISGNQFDSPTISDFSGGLNYIRGNNFGSGDASYTGGGRKSIVYDNYLFTGAKATQTVAKTASYTVLVADQQKTFNNTGATALVPFTLPAAAEGLEYEFHVTDGDGLSITSVGDDVIVRGTTISAAAATITSTTIGSVIRLRGINSSTWLEVAGGGTWA
jgi:hypothetical protein